MRFSIRGLMTVTPLVALLQTVIVQSWRHHETELRHRRETTRLRDQLHAAHQVLRELAVDDRDRAYVLAMPSFAYGRWALRIYMPPGTRYALRVNVGCTGPATFTSLPAGMQAPTQVGSQRHNRKALSGASKAKATGFVDHVRSAAAPGRNLLWWMGFRAPPCAM